MIRADEGLDTSLRNPELVLEAVSIAPVPLPAGLPLVLGAVASLGLLRFGRRRGLARAGAT